MLSNAKKKRGRTNPGRRTTDPYGIVEMSSYIVTVTFGGNDSPGIQEIYSVYYATSPEQAVSQVMRESRFEEPCEPWRRDIRNFCAMPINAEKGGIVLLLEREL